MATFWMIAKVIFTAFMIVGILAVFMLILACIKIGTRDDDEWEEFFSMNDKKYMAHWYDQDEEIKVDGPIYARSEEEAKNIAYRRYNGRGPGPMLWLEEIKK